MGRDAKAAYERLVRECAGDLFRFAYRLSGERAVAEDLVQECFTEAWKGFEGLREARAGRAWLFSILRHRWSHHLRRLSRRPRPDGSNPESTQDPRTTTLFEDRDLLQKALSEVDERHRVPLLMVFVEGLTCQEVADQLGLPLGTVLSRIHRARKRIRGALGDLPTQAQQAGADVLPLKGAHT